MVDRKIKVNKAQCKKCGDVIESKTVNNMKRCSCGSIAVDGGLY
jgi:predicted Zn-ribbon and HTH transcriptional regulator